MNESTIAVGNMKVNARGDELGPGGKVIRTRDQVMRDYYALKTPVAVDENLSNEIAAQQVAHQIPQEQGRAVDPAPVIEADPEPIVVSADSGIDEEDMGEPETVATPAEPALRSSFADSVAKTVTINQKPLPNPKKAKGIQRF
jgi:hypothetical protein